MSLGRGGRRWCLEPKRSDQEWNLRQCRRQLEFQNVLACATQQKPKPIPGRWKLQRLAKGLSIPETSFSAGSLGFAAKVLGVWRNLRERGFPFFFLFTADILHSSAWNHLPHTTTNIGAVEQFFHHPHKISNQETQSLIICKQKTYKQKHKCYEEAEKVDEEISYCAIKYKLNSWVYFVI